MATAFSRTLRTSQADRPGRALGGILLAATLLGGWVAWSAAARITLYEVTGSARLEVDRAAYAVQAPIQGKVVESRLPVARDVAGGDVLVQLDAASEKLQLAQKRAGPAALGPEMEAVRTQVTALERACGDERQ